MSPNTYEIWLSPPVFDETESNFLNQAIQTGWLAPSGPYNEQFETAIAKATHTNEVYTTITGTAAIHLALVLAGVSKNDLVMVPAFAFAASVNPIIYQGAIPYFIDVEETTWGMDPEKLENTLSKLRKEHRTPKAILAIDAYGQLANWQALQQIAKAHGIRLIEDAAAALGSMYQERPAGSFGDYSALSFNGNKIITTTQGGALLSSHPNTYMNVAQLSKQARYPGFEFQYSSIGYNYGLSNLLAAIGCAQITKLSNHITKKRSLFKAYQEGFSETDIQLLPEPANHTWNRWLINICVPETHRTKILAALQQASIEARAVWSPLPTSEPFKVFPASTYSVSQKIHSQWISIPSGINLRSYQCEQIIEIVNKSI